VTLALSPEGRGKSISFYLPFEERKKGLTWPSPQKEERKKHLNV
jgi:hypothetical protein